MVRTTLDHDENIKCYFFSIFYRIGIVSVLKNLARSEFLFFMTHFFEPQKTIDFGNFEFKKYQIEIIFLYYF